MNSTTMKSLAEQISFPIWEDRQEGVFHINEYLESGTEAAFGLELKSIVKKAPDNHSTPPAHLLERIAEVMRPGWWLEFVYSFQSGIFQWKAAAGALGANRNEAVDNARTFYEDFRLAMRTDMQLFAFQPKKHAGMVDRHSVELVYTRPIRPRCFEINLQSHSMGFVLSKGNNGDVLGNLRLPMLPTENHNSFNRIGQILSQCTSPVEVRCRFTRVALQKEAAKTLESALKWFQNGRGKRIGISEEFKASIANDSLLNMASSQLALWLHTESGVQLDVSVASSVPIPAVLAMAIGRQFNMELDPDMRHEAADFEIDPGMKQGVDLSNCVPLGYSLPTIVPALEDLDRSGTPRIFNHHLPHLQAQGVMLGNATDGIRSVPVRFHENDRSRHCYVLGATGTGKSTLLANMIIQDVENGEGVTVIDPHGDLYRQVLTSLPPHRYNDLVIVDPTSSEWSVGMNFLECRGEDRNLQVYFVVNEMMKIFQRLYLREHMGPIFEMFMRNALLLLLEQPLRQTYTLLEVSRLFEDKTFRDQLKKTCTNPMVERFWEKTAEHGSGDWSLPNMSAYVTSKLNQFIYNGRVRAIIGQPTTSINLREVLDSRKILLINLSKGQLGELDSQFLGMIILGKLFGAALSRAAQSSLIRIPHYLYIDEFQNFTTETVAHMMSEARKFELRLVLANQNLGQLESPADADGAGILESVLGNAASIFTFRTGVKDAAKVKEYLEPEYDAQDLQYLPDYHVAAKLLVKNVPTRPFIFQTEPYAEIKVSNGLRSAIQRSFKRYSRPYSRVNAEILDRMTGKEAYNAMLSDTAEEYDEDYDE